MRTQRFAANHRYLPLDELLELPRVRVLRCLRHFDWATMKQVCDWLNENDHASWQALNSALKRHVESGSVELRDSTIPRHYRITQAGRAELAQLLARGEVNEEKVR